MSHNPFIVPDAGPKVGDTVTVKWTCDKRNGGGTNIKTGPVSEIDDWIRVEGTLADPGFLHIPLSYIFKSGGSIVKAPTVNPFMVA